ncbi:tetratricopeptide repeat protein [Scytonema hofmannii FACHB-248]|uniref:Tetratricopeptide repeat protein n=1 Tax=Scytonema hofmannii FACHB-248 TaxID=1842502 RepID=A0ABR8GKN3_9CYAN|nr:MULTISPECIES: tetratricopeptide repeat protein [Nostocales]MBD2603713.1 tetratricopeptide repeat protein [Scytonema hofmannii FACHB-248]
MKRKILGVASLLTTTCVVSQARIKPGQAIQVSGNSLSKDIQTYENSPNNAETTLLVIVILVGISLVFASTGNLVYKALNSVKPKATTADSLPTPKKEHQIEATVGVASETKQSHSATYVEQARTFFKQGDTNKAIALFGHAIRTRPNDAYLYTERANLRRQNLEDKDGALEDYTQAINLHPDNPLFYLWRSQLYYEIGDKFKAMTDYNTAIRLAPEDTMYHSFETKGNSSRG